MQRAKARRAAAAPEPDTASGSASSRFVPGLMPILRANARSACFKSFCATSKDCLLVGQLHLGAQYIHAGGRACIMLVSRQLEQGVGVIHARLSGIDAGSGGLRIQIECRGNADDQIARIALIQLACINGNLAGLEVAISGEVKDVLLRVDSGVVIGEWANNSGQWKAGNGNAKGAQIAVLHVGVCLRIHAREQAPPTCFAAARLQLHQRATRRAAR